MQVDDLGVFIHDMFFLLREGRRKVLLGICC